MQIRSQCGKGALEAPRLTEVVPGPGVARAVERPGLRRQGGDQRGGCGAVALAREQTTEADPRHLVVGPDSQRLLVPTLCRGGASRAFLDRCVEEGGEIPASR